MPEWDAAAAEWYADKYGEYATNRLAVDALELPPGATVVDIGCGTASALRHASTQVTEGKLIGVDPVPRMVEIAAERLAGHDAEDRIELRVGGAEALPVEDRSADVVFAFDSFDHWADKPQGLAEVKRILKPEGRLVVVKDDVPGQGQTFDDAAREAGFRIVRKRQVDQDGVRFTDWVAVIDTSG